jgi:hypothetical protein
MDRLMAPDNRKKAYEASRAIGEAFEAGAAGLIEAAATRAA